MKGSLVYDDPGLPDPHAALDLMYLGHLLILVLTLHQRIVKCLPIHKLPKRFATGENMPPVVKRFHTLAQTASGARHRRKMGIHDGLCRRKVP